MSEPTGKRNRWIIWLTPGIGVKRWFGFLLAGAALIGLGFAMLLVELYRLRPDPIWSLLLHLARFPLWAWALICGAAGGLMALLSTIRINRNILDSAGVDQADLAAAMRERVQKQRGPQIVALGGGTGLPTLLRGLKESSANLTAIVTVADDGGSSGRLRRDLGVLPPGDFRNNIAALARDEGLMTQLFQYRFGEGGLEGHSFGNLFISAMMGITGSFEQALSESSRVLAIRGKVLPSTLADVTLMAEVHLPEENRVMQVAGESQIPLGGGRIRRVYLRPEQAPAYPEAVRAILNADLIVIGPGSLYTSILPNLLVPGIAQALKASSALKVYVCNVATQAGETSGFTVMDHVQTLEQHIGRDGFALDVVVANSDFPPLLADSKTVYVQMGEQNGRVFSGRLLQAPLVDPARPWRHDSKRLAEAILGLLAEKGAKDTEHSS